MRSYVDARNCCHTFDIDSVHWGGYDISFMHHEKHASLRVVRAVTYFLDPRIRFQPIFQALSRNIATASSCISHATANPKN